jgi:putative NADH-flavin reductase
MHVAVVGATGNAGSRILAELVRRGHSATAIARNPDRTPKLSGVTAKSGDAADEIGLAVVLKGHDAVISSLRFAATDPGKLIAAVRASGVPRYLVVGGAGSLELALGKLPLGLRLIDAPNFPEAHKQEAAAGCTFLERLQGEVGAELDVPVALRPARSRRADRRLPPRRRPASVERARQQHFLRGLCGRARGRTGKTGARAQALHGRILTARPTSRWSRRRTSLQRP